MIDPKLLAVLIAISGLLTECVMRFFTPASFDRKRFGLPISVVAGVLASLGWMIGYKDVSAMQAVIRGLIVSSSASGVFDAIKTGTVHLKNARR